MKCKITMPYQQKLRDKKQKTTRKWYSSRVIYVTTQFLLADLTYKAQQNLHVR